MMSEQNTDLEQNAVFLLIGDYLDENNFSAIRELIKDFHPADIAFLLNLLSDEDTLNVLQELSDEFKASIIPELSEAKQQFVVEHIHEKGLSQIVEEMDSDDAADLVGLMEKDVQESVLQKVDSEEARDVRELLQHKEDSAGGIMSKEVVAINHSATVEEAIAEIRRAVKETEQIFNVFVVDKKTGIFKGSLPLNKLVLAKAGSRISNLMETVKTVKTGMDQEDVARIAKKYDLVEIPVINDKNQLVGRITHDDILDVIEEEVEEDFGKMAGTGNEEVQEHSPFQISKERMTWLIIGLFGGILSAIIMSRFKLALSEILVLAFFVPVIMAMGGIVGIQSSTITVRGLATGEIVSGQMARRLFRELGVTLITGSLCGFILAGLVIIWQANYSLGFVVGGAMFCVMLISTISGTVIPLLLNGLKIDPAIATGPFVTTFNDILGLSVYFLLTSLFI